MEFKVYRKNRIEYFIEVIGNSKFYYYTNRSESKLLFELPNNNFLKIVDPIDYPKFVSELIECLSSETHLLEIRFERNNSGMLEKEQIEINFVRGADIECHEQAEREFLKKNSGNNIKIHSIHWLG